MENIFHLHGLILGPVPGADMQNGIKTFRYSALH